MPINSTHPTYNVEYAKKTSDAYNGDVLDYIPRLTKQNSQQYQAYRTRGSYFNVTQRTTNALVGAMLRKPYTTNVEDIMVADGMPFPVMLSHILKDILLQGRVGVLVDYNEDYASPFLVPYSLPQICNWSETYVVLQESYYVTDPTDKYRQTIKSQYRELTLEDGVYMVRIWRQKGAKNASWTVSEEYVPTFRGNTLDYIPFVFINPFDTSKDFHKPPLLNLAEVNISHFKTTTDLEHCAHFTALPQPYVVGQFTGDTREVSIGSEEVWMLEQGSSVDYLEFSGAGIKSLMEIIAHKEAQMAAIGTRLLTAPQKGVESAEAIQLKQGSESATLMSIVNATEEAIKMALEWYVAWMGLTLDVEFYMNRDFTNVIIDPAKMNSLLQMLLAGQISQDTFLTMLYEGEVVDDVEDEKERLNGESSDDTDSAIEGEDSSEDSSGDTEVQD